MLFMYIKEYFRIEKIKTMFGFLNCVLLVHFYHQWFLISDVFFDRTWSISRIVFRFDIIIVLIISVIVKQKRKKKKNIYIYIYLYIHWLIGLVGRVFANGPGDLGSIPCCIIPKI